MTRNAAKLVLEDGDLPVDRVRFGRQPAGDETDQHVLASDAANSADLAAKL
jgi:hypothetical protein